MSQGVHADQRCKQRLQGRILMAGADVNALGGKYGSALQAAASKSSPELIRLRSAPVPTQMRGVVLAVLLYKRLLLKAGANVNSRGGRDGSVFRIIKDEECRALLLSWGAIDHDFVGSVSEWYRGVKMLLFNREFRTSNAHTRSMFSFQFALCTCPPT